MKEDVLKQIEIHIDRGIVYPIYEASTHLRIYNLIGEKREEVLSLDTSFRYLFVYLQDNASQLMISSLAKVFDQDKKSFSVYSLLKQCENYKRTNENKKVIRTEKSKELVKYFNFNDELIEIIKNPNKGNFFQKFNKEYLGTFLQGFDDELTLLKELRNMHISHNDKKFNGINFKVNKLEKLIILSKNIVELILFLIPIGASYDIIFSSNINSNTFYIKDSLSRLSLLNKFKEDE